MTIRIRGAELVVYRMVDGHMVVEHVNILPTADVILANNGTLRSLVL